MDLERIKSVIDLMSENDLCEFSIEEKDFKLSLKRGGVAPVVYAAPGVASGVAPAAAPVAAAAGAAPAAAAAAPAAGGGEFDADSVAVGGYVLSREFAGCGSFCAGGQPRE